MSFGNNMSPTELEDFELGRLITTISNITYDDLQSFADAMDVYQIIKPSLNRTQQDAWEIVLDLMQQEREEAIA